MYDSREREMVSRQVHKSTDKGKPLPYRGPASLAHGLSDYTHRGPINSRDPPLSDNLHPSLNEGQSHGVTRHSQSYHGLPPGQLRNKGCDGGRQLKKSVTNFRCSINEESGDVFQVNTPLPLKQN